MARLDGLLDELRKVNFEIIGLRSTMTGQRAKIAQQGCTIERLKREIIVLEAEKGWLLARLPVPPPAPWWVRLARRAATIVLMPGMDARASRHLAVRLEWLRRQRADQAAFLADDPPSPGGRAPRIS